MAARPVKPPDQAAPIERARRTVPDRSTPFPANIPYPFSLTKDYKIDLGTAIWDDANYNVYIDLEAYLNANGVK